MTKTDGRKFVIRHLTNFNEIGCAQVQLRAVQVENGTFRDYKLGSPNHFYVIKTMFPMTSEFFFAHSFMETFQNFLLRSTV